jgi:8-oxo-dGTP pyrophosphatase MutT (NUDIX family)
VDIADTEPENVRAASLLLLSSGPGRRVLMGRRPRSARFMPGVYVFPGGAVESADATLAVARELDPRDVALMALSDPAEARALAVAAIRETFEETGLLCACGGAPGTSWPTVIEGGANLDLSCLRYLGRALTPAVSHIRFHARFFYLVTDWDDPPLAASTELEDLCWVDPGDPGDPGELPMPRVTRFMLAEVERRLVSGVRPLAAPFCSRDSGEFRVVYDHAPDSDGGTRGEGDATRR